MERLYIVNKDTAKFTGNVLNTMPFVEKGSKHGEDLLSHTYVDYTNGITFADYNKSLKKFAAMNNIILTIQNGLRTKFDASQVKFKKTFAKAKKHGIDLNDTTLFIKKDAFYYKVSFVSGVYKSTGKYWEDLILLPFLKSK